MNIAATANLKYIYAYIYKCAGYFDQQIHFQIYPKLFKEQLA